MAYLIAADVGTTTLKACLFELNDTFRTLAESDASYDLFPMPDGGMEQDHEQWWSALCRAVRSLVDRSGIPPEEIAGISLCAQMLGLVLVDRQGVPVRRPMNYMDRRSVEEQRRGIGHGLTLSGGNLRKLLISLAHTRLAPVDPGDPLWKYKWVEAHEPEHFSRVHCWLDVKDYLNLRCTGVMAATEDTASVTMLYENFRGTRRFSPRLLRMYGVRPEHMPRVIRSTDVVGPLTPQAAEELGLVPGIPVFGGGGDANCIPLGGGCAALGRTHVYMGTSGWVSTVCAKQTFDPLRMIASIYGAEEGRFHYHAEMNAAGKCYEWVRDHIALDSLHFCSSPRDAAYDMDIYDRLSRAAETAPPGSGGVIFAPWLSGERCPISTSQPCGMFFNLSLQTGKAELIRSVLEGICYHINWMLECHEKRLPASPTLRLLGGGALSPAVCQILADVTGRPVDTIPCPQNAGALGAAVISAAGLGLIPGLAAAEQYIPADRTYRPDPKNHALYRRSYTVFKKLYASNKKLFAQLGRTEGPAP